MTNTILDEVINPGTYEIPLSLNEQAYKLVQKMKKEGHALTHDETYAYPWRLIQIRIFHYKTCKKCEREKTLPVVNLRAAS